MIIWHYDRNTGELLGADVARPDPTPQGKAVGRHLIPAHATTIAPPQANDGHATVFDPSSGTWNQVAYLPPPPPAPQQVFEDSFKFGLTINWTVSPSLNGTYALDQATQNNIATENIAIMVKNTFSNGRSTKSWPDLSGKYHSFTIEQFKAFATQVDLYVDALIIALDAAESGQDAPWPDSTITINA